MRSRDVIKLLLADGWTEVARKGSHVQFRHPTKKGRVTVPDPGHSSRHIAQHRESIRIKAEMMARYIALLHKEPGSDYGVSFPDFPGCISAGETLEEARLGAEEALSLHVEGMIEDGETLPQPSSLDDVMHDPGNRDGVAILVSAPDKNTRSIRVNVTLPEDVLRQIDAFAQDAGYTRSGFLALAARHEIERETKRK